MTPSILVLAPVTQNLCCMDQDTQNQDTTRNAPGQMAPKGKCNAAAAHRAHRIPSGSEDNAPGSKPTTTYFIDPLPNY